MFTHRTDITPIEMEAKMLDGQRLYFTPEGNKYPSVTTVISNNAKKAKAIAKWRQFVGEEKANNITKRSTTRGTNFHSIVEDYINNELDLKKYKEHPLPVLMFKHSKDCLDNINNILLQEAALYSDHLELAGRVDCIAEYNGLLSIIDFKTSAKEKKEAYLYDYFVQETAYACMLLERYKLRVKQLVTIVSCEDGETQVVIRPLKKEYLASLFKYIDEYQNKHGKK